MSETKEKTEYKIDVTGKRLGRIASEIATILMGKNKADFAPNVVANVKVQISGVDSMDISDKRREGTTYKRYSGYPGGQRVLPMEKIIEKKGYAEVLKIAVEGMIPRNKLRKGRMKNLVIVGKTE